MATTHQIYVMKSKPGIRMTIERVPLNKLKLDPNNVRFRHLNRKLKEDEIEDLIWNENETRYLYNAILDSGGLSEKPFVSLKNVVKEGNRRIVCLRNIVRNIKEGHLKDINLARFETVECEMPIDDIAPLEMDLLVARFHITGKKEWGALNQAGHIYDLYHNRGLSYDEIRGLLQIPRNRIVVNQEAYRLTVEYMEAYPDDAEIKRFTYFSEIYKKLDTREWLEDDEKNSAKFFKWIHDKKFDDGGSGDVRKLGPILKNKEAMQELASKGGTFSSARSMVTKKDITADNKTFKTIKRAIAAIENMPRNEFKSLARNSLKQNLLIELQNKIKNVFKELEA